MNLFFSSLAMRAAKARPIPEEQPVMRTTFWFMVWRSPYPWSSEESRRASQLRFRAQQRRRGAADAETLIHTSATQQKVLAADYQCARPTGTPMPTCCSITTVLVLRSRWKRSFG